MVKKSLILHLVHFFKSTAGKSLSIVFVEVQNLFWMQCLYSVFVTNVCFTLGMDPRHTHQIEIVEGQNPVSRSVTAGQARSYSDQEGMNKHIS